MPNLKDGWFADRSPGGGKVIYTTPGNPATATPIGGLVGVGADSGVTPIPAQFPALPEPTTGTFLPPPGASGRASYLKALAAATGFDSKTYLTGVTATTHSRDAISLSCFMDFGVTNVVGFVPNAGLGAIWESGDTFNKSNINLAPPPQVSSTDYNTFPTLYPGVYPYPGDATTNAGWTHVMISYRVINLGTIIGDTIPGSSRMQLVVNDTVLVDAVQVAANPLQHALDFTNNIRIGGDGTPGDVFTPGAGLYGAIAELWVMPNLFVDWTVAANRYKFHCSDAGFGLANVTYAPVDIGSAGQRPFGLRPAVYCSGRPGVFVTNRATGTILTVNGDALVLVDDPPLN